MGEASKVEELYRLVEPFPDPERARIQDLAESYDQVLAEEERPLLGQGSESRPSPRAEMLAGDLRS